VGVAGSDPKDVGPAGRLLLGRDRELERLFGMIDRIGKRGGALVLRGEAGIGKSALLEAVRARALEQGATVVTTTGTQSETRFAFGDSISCCFRSSTAYITVLVRSAGPSRWHWVSARATRLMSS
jgi:predicted ATPase